MCDENIFDYGDTYANLIPTLKEVISLSVDRDFEMAEENNEVTEDFSVDNLKRFQIKGKDKELYEYLCSIDKELLLDIICIMYIGRDDSHKNKYGHYSIENTRKELDFLEKEEQENIASQIRGKVALTKYLSEGANKLSIRLYK